MWNVEPSVGSYAGGARITIFGSGFTNASSTGLANKVLIGTSECQVIQLHSTPNQIVCKTPPHTSRFDRSYLVRVWSNGVEASCRDSLASTTCHFRYQNCASCRCLVLLCSVFLCRSFIRSFVRSFVRLVGQSLVCLVCGRLLLTFLCRIAIP